MTITFRLTLVLLGTLVTAAPTGASAASAEALYKRGVAAFERGQFRRSRALLRRARQHAASPRLVGSIAIYLGVNHAVMGDTARARASFAAAMRHDATLELDRHRHKPAIVKLFDAVRKGMRGYLAVDAAEGHAGATVSVDGKPAGEAPLHKALGIGRHEVEVRGDDGAVLLTREVVVAPERTTRLQITPPEPKPSRRRAGRADDAEHWVARPHRRGRPRRPRRIWTWVAAGGAVVAGAVGIGFGVAALSNHDEYQTTLDPSRFDDLTERIPTQVTVANTMYVLSGVFAAGAVALYLLEGRAWGDRPRRRRSLGLLDRLPVTPAVGRSSMLLSVQREF